MKLTLIRHAQSMGNSTGNYSLLESDSLSAIGRKQAQELARALESEVFDKIIVSPLTRALETIAPYLEKTHQEAEVWPEITEMRWQTTHEPRAAAWPHEPAEIPSDLPDRFTFFDDRRIKPAATLSEKPEEQRSRLYDAKERVEQLHREGYTSVLMVSHGIFIRELVCALLQLPGVLSFPADNCSAQQIASKDGKNWDVHFLNRLAEPPSPNFLKRVLSH
ncbi:MAG: histidine phosphatase family protein [Opitutales bacterium]|nr:histidine phosphatase family protein [Opitutales bacterium]